MIILALRFVPGCQGYRDRSRPWKAHTIIQLQFRNPECNRRLCVHTFNLNTFFLIKTRLYTLIHNFPRIFLAFISFLLCVAAEVLNYLFLQSLFRFSVLPWGPLFHFLSFFFVNFSPWKLDSILGKFKLVCLQQMYMYVCKAELSLSFALPALGSDQPAFSFLISSSFPFISYFYLNDWLIAPLLLDYHLFCSLLFVVP
jgi:hypothetical protein